MATPMLAGGRRVQLHLGVFRSIPKLPLVIIMVAVTMAVLADFLIGRFLPEAAAIDLAAQYLPPLPASESDVLHPLGTDRLGRDVLSRLLMGGRLSLSLALLVILMAATLGTGAGLLAGYRGGRVDAVVMRTVDVALSFPAILVALVLVVTIGSSFGTVLFALTVYMWPQFARVVRAETLSWKERGFVVMARVIGVPGWLIVVRHLLPNVLNSIIVLASLQIGWVILMEAALSFLGAGVPPPTPTLGGMIADGRSAMEIAWWLTVIPGIAVTLLVLSFNLLGDWLRDTLDPRLRQLVP